MNKRIHEKILDIAESQKEVSYETLTNVYSLVANRYCQSFNETFGTCNSRDCFNLLQCFQVKVVQISGEQFKEVCVVKKINGKVVRPKYAKALQLLESAGIVHVNSHYQAKKFCKSYSLDNQFAMSMVADWFESGNETLHIYEALNGWLPNKYVQKLVRRAKTMFESVKNDVHDGLSLSFPKGFFSSFDEFGYCKTDSELSIENVILGLECFIDKKRQHQDNFVDGRNYNWIARMPKKFRKYVGLREIADMNASAMVMLSKLGVESNAIDRREFELIFGLLESKTDIYEALNTDTLTGKPIFETRDEVKTAVMFMAFGNSRQINCRIFMKHDEQMKLFKERFKDLLPTMSAWLSKFGYVKNEKIKDASELFRQMSFVEKAIMEDAISKIPVKCWRVHDAIWTDADFDDEAARAILLESVKNVRA